MAPQDNRSRSDETSAETTAALPDDLDELHEPTSTSAEEAVPALEELPSGSALLLVTRGRNAGARFLLDRDFMAAGRHPDSDIFLDDITVSRPATPSFGVKKAYSASSMPAASTARISTVSP